jgi:hypothetical protein
MLIRITGAVFLYVLINVVVSCAGTMLSTLDQ